MARIFVNVRSCLFNKLKANHEIGDFKVQGHVRCKSNTHILLNWLFYVIGSQFECAHDKENCKLKFINMSPWQNTRPLSSKIWREKILVSKDLSLILKIKWSFKKIIRSHRCGTIKPYKWKLLKGHNRTKP